MKRKKQENKLNLELTIKKKEKNKKSMLISNV